MTDKTGLGFWDQRVLEDGPSAPSSFLAFKLEQVKWVKGILMDVQPMSSLSTFLIAICLGMSEGKSVLHFICGNVFP